MNHNSFLSHAFSVTNQNVSLSGPYFFIWPGSYSKSPPCTKLPPRERLVPFVHNISL